jgi:hypothetical protein
MKTAYAILLYSVISLAPPSLTAATFTVTTTNISGPGSLPVVITQANASPGPNMVQFGVTNALTLAFQLATITNDLTIIGRTDVPTVISGGGNLPIFTFAEGTTNVLSQLVLIDGNTTGGGAAINNAGTLSVSSCVMSNNGAPRGNGGAVSNAGTMTVVSSTIAGNQAASGGGIYNADSLTIVDTALAGNQAGIGGAIYNVGTLILNGLTISNNQGSVLGGGLYNSGTLAAAGSTFASNRTSGNDGQNGTSGQLDSNFAPGYTCGSGGGGGGGGGGGLGGGLFTTSGTVLLTNCTFFGNISNGGQGGNGAGGGSYKTDPTGSDQPEGGTGGDGGGIGDGAGGIGGQWGDFSDPFPPGGNGDGTNGGVGAMAAGGGGGGGSTLGQSGTPGTLGHGGSGGLGGGNGGWGGMGSQVGQLEEGETGYGGNGGSGWGAGIFAKDANLVIVNCTITANTCAGGTGGTPSFADEPFLGGQPGLGIGGGIYNNSASVTLVNTIIAANGASDASPDLVGAFTSSGFNLIGNNQGATNLSINDFQNVSANLGPLQDNGGPTLTCVPQPGSLAIGYGSSTGAPPTDQRGVPRPQGGAVDIGAVQSVTTAPVYIDPSISTVVGFSVTAIFDSTNAYRVQGSTNLITWIDMTNYPNGGPGHVLDSSATILNQRFYRAVVP